MEIRAIIKEPGKHPELITIENRLSAFQSKVGGYIETVTIDDIVIIVDEEGYLKGKPYNCKMAWMHLFGTIIITGRQVDEFADCPYSVEKLAEMYPQFK